MEAEQGILDCQAGVIAAADCAAHLVAKLPPERLIGAISFSILENPALLRLSPEACRAMRSATDMRIRHALRRQDHVFAIQPWEWLAVLDNMPSDATLRMAMAKIDGLFSFAENAQYGLPPADIAVGGAVSGPEEDAFHLIQSARIARWHASRMGNRTGIYEVTQEGFDLGYLQLHAQLLEQFSGIDQGLALYLQPQVDLADGHCRAAEALLRWCKASGEHVPPGRILAVVERFGLRHRFARWLLQQAAQVLARLRQKNVTISLSVNFTASDLLDAELSDLVSQALTTWNVPSECLCIELTETGMIEDSKQASQALNRLRQLGVRLAVDDFGTGYASIRYLQRLPVQEVKIDQSFVRHAETSPRDREIIASVVQLAHRLGMEVVAEGVETEAAAAIVAALGCDRAQGYRYAPALPLEEFIAWWRGRESRR